MSEILGTEKLKQQVQSQILDFLLQGYPYSEIVSYLQMTYNFSPDHAKELYRKGKDKIYELGDIDIDQVVVQHLFYYEEAIRYFDSIGDYSAKAVGMAAKEKLLKIFNDESPLIEIENNVNINVQQFSNFDVHKLTSTEQDRMQELLYKVKRLTS